MLSTENCKSYFIAATQHQFKSINRYNTIFYTAKMRWISGVRKKIFFNFNACCCLLFLLVIRIYRVSLIVSNAYFLFENVLGTGSSKLEGKATKQKIVCVCIKGHKSKSCPNILMKTNATHFGQKVTKP